MTLYGDEHIKAYRESNGESGYDWRGATILSAHHHRP